MTDTDREFEEATKYTLQVRDIEMARALVGVETPNRSREQLTVATPDAIRNYARAVGDDCDELTGAIEDTRIAGRCPVALKAQLTGHAVAGINDRR